MIDFDIVQVGTTQMRGVKIINPTDEPLMIGLFITTVDVYNTLIKQKTGETSSHKPPNPSDKDYFF